MKNKKTKNIQTVKDINIYFCLSLLVLVPLLLNWKIINYDYTKLDDTTIITNNYSFLSDFKNVLKTFEKDNFLSKEGKGYYRPVQTISFMIDAQISGDKPQAYHFFNLFYHILTVISLFFLLKLFGIKNNLSLLLSLLFAVHPLFTDAISWIVGRGDILAGLFGTLSIILFIKYNDTDNKLYYFLHCAAFGAAIFSKEISVFIPVIIIFYYWFVKNNKYKIRRLLPFLGFWVLSIVFFIYLRNKFLNPQDIISFDSFIKNLPVIPIFFAKWFLPFGLSPMPVYSLFYTIAGIILLALSTYYIIKFKPVNKNIILLGALWFLAFILPGMFVRVPLALNHFEYLECRTYFPSIGIFLSAGLILNELIRRNNNIKPGKYFIPLIIFFSVLTFTYSNVFASPIEFYSSVIDEYPENAYALCSRGSLYSSTGKFDQALTDFDHSIRAVSNYSEPYYNKGMLYNSIGNHQLAEKYYEDALHYDTLFSSINNLHEYAFINLSSIKLNLKKYDETIELLKKCDIKYPGNCSVHNNLGLAYYSKTDYHDAIDQYDRAIAGNNSIYSYYNNRGMAQYQLKNFRLALEDFNNCLKLNAEFPDAWTNRGITKIELKDYEGAIADLSTSIKYKPQNGVALYFRGVAYSKLNKDLEAEENWQNAAKFGYRIPVEKSR